MKSCTPVTLDHRPCSTNSATLHPYMRCGAMSMPLRSTPPTFTGRYGKVEIHVRHELPRPQSTLRDWAQAGADLGKSAGHHRRRFLESLPPEARVVIFGHSHEPCALLVGDRLFFNPGSAGKRRFSLPRCCGLLEISQDAVRATFLSLERYNGDLPEGVCLPIGGA